MAQDYKIEPTKTRKYFFHLFSIKSILVFIFIILVLITINLYFYYRSNDLFSLNCFKDFVQIIGISGSIIGIWLVGVSLHLQFTQNKLQNTFNFIREYDKIAISKEERKLLHNNIILSEDYIKTKIDLDEELQLNLSNRFNYFEDLSIAIQHKYIDEHIAAQSLQHIVITNFNVFHHWVTREKQSTYVDSKLLFEKWKDKKSILTGKEFKMKLSTNTPNPT